MRQLMERLGVARAIDAGVRVLRRCKWYRESDHILTLIYSMVSGGSGLQDVNRLGQDDALKRVLGSDRIPHAATIGKFLWRFGDDQKEPYSPNCARLSTKRLLSTCNSRPRPSSLNIASSRLILPSPLDCHPAITVATYRSNVPGNNWKCIGEEKPAPSMVLNIALG